MSRSNSPKQMWQCTLQFGQFVSVREKERKWEEEKNCARIMQKCVYESTEWNKKRVLRTSAKPALHTGTIWRMRRTPTMSVTCNWVMHGRSLDSPRHSALACRSRYMASQRETVSWRESDGDARRTRSRERFTHSEKHYILLCYKRRNRFIFGVDKALRWGDEIAQDSGHLSLTHFFLCLAYLELWDILKNCT